MASATCLVVSAPVAGCSAVLNRRVLTKCKSLMVQSRSLRENGPRLNKRAHPCCLGDDARTCTQPEPPRIGKTIPGRREPDTNAASLPDDVIQKAYSEGEEFVGLHRRLVSVSLAAISSFLALSFTLEAAAAVTEGDPRPSQGGATTGKGGKKANVFELNGGVKALDVRIGSGPSPKEGDKIAIHYYGRLGAKQGWRFDSSYEHRDLFGVPEPYVFTVGSGQVIAGIDTAVRSMRVGGIRRVVIPPDQGYQNKEQGPVPPDFFDRQRLYTTIFNPTRLANGEGATLGTVIFDLELVRIQS